MVNRWFSKTAVVALGLAAISSCKRSDPRLEDLNITEAEARAILAELSAKPLASSKAAPGPVHPQGPAPLKPQPAPQTPYPEPTDWRLDAPVVIAPATRSAAHPTGVLLIDTDDRLHLSSLNFRATNSKTSLTPIDPAPSTFGKPKLGRGPSFDQNYVYWIRRNLLLRRPLRPPHEPLEVLATDARVGTRVSAISSGEIGSRTRPSWVQYIALPREKGGPLRAKLWYGADATMQLSHETHSILSAGLVESRGRAYFFGIEARTGMSALHARQLRPRRGEPTAPPLLEDDEIVWFGPQAQPWTELKLQPDSQTSIVALLAQGRDSKTFGLASLALTPRRADTTTQRWKTVEAQWEMYANGLDPAPVATGRVCGKSRVLLVRPVGPKPRSPQELMMAELIDGSLQRLSHVTTATVIFDVSVAPLAGGALVSYVADRKVWAQTIRCRN